MSNGSGVLCEQRHVVMLCRSASSMGEYRGIMNLCRVLPQGTAAKLAVDKAIDRLSTIGSIREDIQRCCLLCVNSLCSARRQMRQHPCRHPKVLVLSCLVSIALCSALY
jgi:hypothetical protein